MHTMRQTTHREPPSPNPRPSARDTTHLRLNSERPNFCLYNHPHVIFKKRNPPHPPKPAIMFGAPPQPSKQELAAAEAQTMSDIKWTAASAVVLYLSPHLVEYVSKLF
ncbi:Mitochondrial outer membrane translocase complex subunit Tom5 [Pyrenophora seminiperda CCB06]|uniref:Mitochondrial outer membrane translocase complex subunit Tom5 n=3 Tax=Pyrenophora TaxID=5027 RepID=A0A3M7LXV2_9PLEO|nr:Mitochondrial outer membrane translocase complex subunit Tom5 [Pyrenophora seminiperda CCB06]